MTKRNLEVRRLGRALGAIGHEALTSEEASRAWMAWCETFLSRVRPPVKQDEFHWEPFGQQVFALDGDAARQAYRGQHAVEFYVFAHGHPPAGFRCTAQALPWFDLKTLDAYVSPLDMAWTMVFTHESYGPYFTTAAWAKERVPAGR